MTLPSGAIKDSDINTELGRSSTAQLSMNDSSVRLLANKSSGAISYSDLHSQTYPNFNYPSGTSIDVSDPISTGFNLICTTNVTWTYTRSGDLDKQNITPANNTVSDELDASQVARQTPPPGQLPSVDDPYYRTYTQGTIQATFRGTQVASWTYSIDCFGNA